MYTTIIHSIRKQLELNCNEYCVLDTIYHLSNNSKFNGWCIKSKENISYQLDLSRQTVHNIIDKLIDIGLVEKSELKHLRTTEKYCELISKLDSKETLHDVNNLYSDSKETLHEPVKKVYNSSKKTLHNNNINITVNNDINNYLPYNSKLFTDCWEKLIAQPKWKKKTKDAYISTLHELSEYSEQDAIKMMTKTISGNYQGIFPLPYMKKTKNNDTTSKETNPFLVRATS